MPVIPIRRVLVANEAVPNLIAGSVYEYLPFPARVEIAVQADAVGVLASVSSGPDILMEEGAIQIAAINVQPKYPDDFYLTDNAAPGDRLVIRVRDTSGAARTVVGQVRITPLMIG